MTTWEALAGQTIGQYVIEKHIAEGTVSDVYLAHDSNVEETVAIKLLRDDVMQDETFVERFRRKMSLVSRLDHPNVVQIHDVGTTPSGQLYVAMAYVEGESLADKIAQLERGEAFVSGQDALMLIRQMAEGLTELHQAGVIHHDLRPDHILLRSDGTPVLIGVAGSSPYARASKPPVIDTITMLDYASPEEAEGEPLDERSNTYSLGIILYELLTGSRPRIIESDWNIFSVTPPSEPVPLEEVRTDLTADTYYVVRTCTRRQVWARFQTGEEVIASIDQALIAEEERQREVALPILVWRAIRNRVADRWWLYGIIPLALLLLGFGAARFLGQSTPVETPTLAPEEIQVIVPPDLAGTEAALTAAAPAPTETPTPPLIVVELLQPVRNAEIELDDPAEFSWRWPGLLEMGQQFALYLLLPDREVLAGTVSEPAAESEYRLEVTGREFVDLPGIYQWQVRLETISSGQSTFASEWRPIRLVIGGLMVTPTLTPTATEISTATPTPTITPTPTPECVRVQPPGWISYRVQRGDSLSRLATQSGTTVSELRRVNCLTTILLSVGQQLWLPPAAATATPAPTNTPVPTTTDPPPPPPPPPGDTPPPPPPPSPTPLPPTPTPPIPEP